MDLSRDGSLLATAGADSRVFVSFPDRSGKETVVATMSIGWPVVGVRFDPIEPHHVLILKKYGTAPELWSWGSDGKTKLLRTYEKPPLLGNDYLTSLAISPDGTTVACGDTRGTIHLWDARTGEPRAHREFRSAAQAPDITFDPSGQLLAATGQDEVLLWELGTSSKQPTRLPHSNATKVAFDPSGQHLVSTAEDRTVKVRTRDGKLDRVLVAHGNLSSEPSFSKDSGLFAAGTTDGLVEIWDVQSGVTVMVDRHHGDSVNSVVFLPSDRSRLISGSDDKTVAQFGCRACSDKTARSRKPSSWQRLTEGSSHGASYTGPP
jgi:WD40 repeat protein